MDYRRTCRIEVSVPKKVGRRITLFRNQKRYSGKEPVVSEVKAVNFLKLFFRGKF